MIKRTREQAPRAAVGKPGAGESMQASTPLLALQRAAGNQATTELITGMLQRQAGSAPALQRSAAELVEETVASGGHALDAGVQREMQSALGHDFSDVRVHIDSQAADSARAVGAKAYTTGSHLVFAEGEYRPGSGDGKQLLAHELTHVKQQASGPVDATDTGDGLAVSTPGDPFEREADEVAAGFEGGA